jgi:hypothetical protein
VVEFKRFAIVPKGDLDIEDAESILQNNVNYKGVLP